MRNFLITTIVIISLFFSACVKKRAIREVEDQKITNFISESGLEFDTTRSGAIYHITFDGNAPVFDYYSIVPIIYTGFYLDNNKKVVFIENDTVNIQIGNPGLMKGWSEVLQKVGDGGAGIIIFPYYLAFKNKQTPNIPSNSTIYYYFRVRTDNYSLAQTYEFFKYAEMYDSISTFFDDSLCYVKYFDGLGPNFSTSGGNIDFVMRNIYDTIYLSSDNFFVNSANPNLTAGLLEGLSKMSEGEMGKIIVPPSLSFSEENDYGIPPYSAMNYEVRVIASDPEIEEKSKIDKYLYLNKVVPDSIFANGIYYFVDSKPEADDLPDAHLNSFIYYSDSLYLINAKTPVSSCQNCYAQANSSNFDNFLLNCITTIKAGEAATFLIPYSVAYGASGLGQIPPYATLMYKVRIDSIK